MELQKKHLVLTARRHIFSKVPYIKTHKKFHLGAQTGFTLSQV